ncbi:MAG TPA: SMI1/KNR4 family protein, partial [Thermoanaerobaculia bacterium]|nr:SMI1/KNR4 family protein [Thermoanaerobaculia bacterium]
AIAAVEQKLGVRLPQALRELLLESDGVTADNGSSVVWPLADIQRRNQEFRRTESFRDLYMPFDHLLFFGDDGGGDQFAFAIQADGRIHNPDVFRWEHETDARSWFASHLESFFSHRLNQDHTV